jgi:hypothetical protein
MEIAHPSNSWIDQKFFVHRMLNKWSFNFLNYLILMLMFISLQYDPVLRVTQLRKLFKVYTEIWAFK